MPPHLPVCIVQLLVCRERGRGWRVYISPFIQAVQVWEECDAWSGPENLEREEDEGRMEAFREILDSQDDWARSEDEGWFYSD
jgi:hypothetical protein